ncbi:MAG: helix-turn-helix domain-containing protein [Phycisphaerae bacterium]
MTDQAHEYESDDGRPRVNCERQPSDTVQGAACRLSSLPDPCTSAQLAAVLGKSPKTLVDWCQEREFTHIPCFRLGNRWYHRVAELVRWLNGIEGGRIDFRRRPRNTNRRSASAHKLR